MKMIRWYWSLAIIGGVALLAACAAQTGAPAGAGVGELGGVVTSGKGPEAGVWVIAGCSGHGAEPNAFEARAFVRMLPPKVNGPELELRGTARDGKGKPLADCVLVMSLEAPDAGTIVGRLRTDEYGRYGVRTVFPRSRAGGPALVEIQFGEPYRAAAVLALAAVGTAGASNRPCQSPYRITLADDEKAEQLAQ